MDNQTSIPVWITRNSAFEIQCGGLERLFIHFSQPVYLMVKMKETERDTPFGYISEREGLFLKYGWVEPNEKMWCPRISVGNSIGYDNPVSEFIWSELQKHFHNKPFEEWHELEKSGESKIEDFCLELKINISI